MTEAERATAGRVQVAAASGGYTVHVGSGVSEALPDIVAEHAAGGRAAFVSDSNVAPLHAERLAEACRRAGLEVELFTFPAGEASKNREQWTLLTDELLEWGLGRDGCVVAVGGGVTTDLGGFVAATYLRGVPVVQVPTSYLAMIDASVGGKTGVDAPAGKNLIGAFHAPAAVVADTALLRTLPERERLDGLVEAVKHGAILDAGHLRAIRDQLSELLDADPDVAGAIVLASVRIKAAVVAEDEREAGYRQVLNFGHTVGHAIEAASAYSLGHGSAVALGMLAEAEVGEHLGVTSEGVRDGLAEVLRWMIKPPPPTLPIERVMEYLGRDKKARGGRPRYVLLERIGQVAAGEGWTYEVPDDLVTEALHTVLEGS